MPSYALNKAGVEQAKKLIAAKQYVLDSDWGDVQPNADAENDFLESHSWEEYSGWHLGLTEDSSEERRPATRSSTEISGAYIAQA